MVLDTSHALAATIRDLHLLTPEQLHELDQLADRYPTVEPLVRLLQAKGWLTNYQLQHIRQGKGKQLFLGPYVLLERLGAGGTGEVYKAQEHSPDRLVALKLFRPDQVDDSLGVQRFLWDAEKAAQLSHPNLATIYDADALGDTPFLAMEYVEGIDLGRLLHQAGPFPVALACDFLAQAARGLHHAHEQGILHRDLKPTNLIVSDPKKFITSNVTVERYACGIVKILEMGLVRVSRDTKPTDPDSAALPLHLGTMDYLAPELASHEGNVDRRADLYSLGCTLYHLLRGAPPFAGGTPTEKLRRHQSEAPVPLSTFRTDISADLDRLVLRLLAKNPEERFDNAEEVAQALMRLAERTPSETRVRVPSPVPRDPSRLVPIGLGVLLLAALVVALIAWWPLRVQRPTSSPTPTDCVGILALQPSALYRGARERPAMRGVDALLAAALPATNAEEGEMVVCWNNGDLTQPQRRSETLPQLVSASQTFQDGRLTSLLEELPLDRACSFVLALDRVEKLPAIPANVAPILRALIEQTATVQGSIGLNGDELHGVVRLTPRNPEQLAQLEQAVKEVCAEARAVDGWPDDYPKTWQPILRLISVARLERTNSEVVVRSRLSATIREKTSDSRND
jgi:serine/threonine-protein kinase